MNTKKTRNLILALVLAVVVLTVVFVGAAAERNRQQNANGLTPPVSAQEAAETEREAVNVARRIPEDPQALGAVDAPVAMIEYSDYACPFCGAYARKTQPEIVKKYVDAGQLRIEWRDLPVLGESSKSAAVAARAAAEQGLFWEYNEAIYAAAPEKGKANLSPAELLALAQQIGVPDMARFTQDMTNPGLVAKVEADLTEGTQLGINSTPTFVINNHSIPGAQPMEVFSQVIGEALAKAK